MKFSILILAFAFLTSCQTFGQQKKTDYADLTANINSIIANNSFNGIVLLTKDSAAIYTKSIGYSDLKKKTPLTINDQFVIGSISKQITAVLVLREYEKGKIRLENKINDYLIDSKQPLVKRSHYSSAAYAHSRNCSFRCTIRIQTRFPISLFAIRL